MPVVTVPESVYDRLAAEAARVGVSVDAYAVLKLNAPAPEPEAAQPLSDEEWFRELDAWEQDIRKRADRYPPGFEADDSRETIYGEREDAQL